MQLAQINIGRIRYSLDDPHMSDFMNNLDRVNAVAERSEGFVWRLKDDTGNATQIAYDSDPRMIVNMSVWESVEALEAFAYKTIHRRFVGRRKEWFEHLDVPFMALWWVTGGHTPLPDEGRHRLMHLTHYGPSPFAFTFTTRFPPNRDAAPLGPVSDSVAPEAFRSCG